MEDIELAAEDSGTVLGEGSAENADTASSTAKDNLRKKSEECAVNEPDVTSWENPSILDLSGKSLESLAVGELSKQLHTLNLSDNHFKILPDEVHQLINLSSLAVSENKLAELPEWIGDLRNLVSLNLSSNNLQSLPASFSKLNLLKDLDLSKNKFSRIPDSLQVGCISLININLSHNSIEVWICCPASVSTLQTIRLAQNSLTCVPPWMCDGKASSLTLLDLSLNPVFGQEQKLSQTAYKSHLKQLYLSHCLLSQSGLNFVGQFPSLTHLELSNYMPKGKSKYANIIREIDVSTLQFHKGLTHLLLRDVSLADLPENINEFVSLEVLDCRDNSLLWLPESMCKLSHLQVCLLSNNTLCILPDLFGALANLRELRLDRNNITCLPESFESLNKLCWLDLYGNQIDDVPFQLEEIIGSLKGLDFEFNLVSLFSEQNDDAVTWLSKERYELLVKEMRSHTVRFGASEIADTCFQDVRANGCRPPSVDKHQYSPGQSSHGDYGSDSKSVDDDDGDGDGDGRSPVPDYEEDWDTAHSDTDNFDPIEHAFRPKPAVVEQKIVFVPPHIIQRHRFCPSDLHVIPTKENTSGINFAPEDGQFDDA